MKISNIHEMRNLDRRAIEEYGISQEVLMENAGHAVYYSILKETGIRDKNFVFFCGTGNNGGDGMVVARKIHSAGGIVTVFILGNRSKFKGAAKKNFEAVEKTGISMVDLNDISRVNESLKKSDIIIDAIFGTGLDREVKGIYSDAIAKINETGKTVFSLDIPSGVNGNSGQVMGHAVKADFTITFGLPKTGNLLYPGFELCGKLYVTHISFPIALQTTDELKIAVNEPYPLPVRKKDSHKGSYGKALFIAGSSNYLGAPYFAAMSFLKAGGGLSFLATPENISTFIANKGSEIIFIPQKSSSSGSISLQNKKKLLEFSEKVDMVVMGPGLSLNEETQTLVKELCSEINKPLLIDGDGITAVAGDLNCILERKAPTILTPHPGEMSSVTQLPIDDILNNKISVLQDVCQKYKAAVVLKGAHSLIGYPDGKVFINLTGNPGMATAGSGDILTGIVAAMVCTGFPLNDAVRMGVFLHGFTGDMAAEKKGEDGMIAGDIMDELPASIKSLRSKFRLHTDNYYSSIYVI